MYHFRVKIISRGKGSGRTAAGAAAYRSGSVACSAAVLAYRAGDRLRDPNTGHVYDYRAKGRIDEDGFGVLHSEIMLPPNAPLWMADRQALVDAVETREKRKDAQLYRELEISLPRELTFDQQRDLLRAFVAANCVSKGMIADIAIHDELASDGGRNPHAHVLLTMRYVSPDGFGLKNTDWHKKDLLKEWREAWATMANEMFQSLGIESRLDHRSHRDRGILLEPDAYVGPKKTRGFDGVMADARAEERSASKKRNLEAIMERPEWLLDAITKEKATFTEHDIDRYITRYTDITKEMPEFSHVFAHVASSRQMVAVSSDQRGDQRYSTREMLNAELEMARAAKDLASRGRARAEVAPSPPHLSDEQAAAYQHVLRTGDLALISGVAGAGKTTMLREVVAALEAEGRNVRGAALAGIAARKLRDEAGVPAKTIASLINGWDRKDLNGQPAPRDPLQRGDVLIVDEAAMVDSRTMRRLLVEAAKANAKVVLVGDSQQLQAIGAGAAFRALMDTHGAAELASVRRQQTEWMREATGKMARGAIRDALALYAAHDAVCAAPTCEDAMDKLVAQWAEERKETRSQLVLSYYTADVEALNRKARESLRDKGELGPDIRVQVKKQVRDEYGNVAERAEYRTFANGDRILFLQNNRELDVQNGTRGVVEKLTKSGDFLVQLDDGRKVSFKATDYPHITQGYASTIHKAQGETVDRTYVLASTIFDAHATYVAMSRHRLSATLFYGRNEFETSHDLFSMLARPRPKDSTLDYLRSPEERERGDGRASMGDGRKGRPQPQPAPTSDFIAAHGGSKNESYPPPRAPQTALDIVRANAAKTRSRTVDRGRNRTYDDS